MKEAAIGFEKKLSPCLYSLSEQTEHIKFN